MKLFIQLFISLVMIGALTRPSWAVDCPSGVPTTTVFYANGILNTPKDAQDAKDALQTQFNQFLTSFETQIQLGCIQFDFVYNRTQGKFLDFYESYRQLSRDEPTNVWLIGAQLLISSTPLFYAQAFLDVASLIDPNLYIDHDDLEIAVQKYRDELFFAGHKVVVVSHSQGNIYANEAYNALYAPQDGQIALTTKSFGIVAVATPANFVEGYASGEERYTTNTKDSILHVPEALQGNVIDSCGDDVENCHHFIGTYLKGSVSRPRIFNDIVATIGLDEPPSTLGIACGNPPQGVVGTPYSHSFSATGGTTPYTFSMIDGELPDGLSLDEDTGEVTGVPEAVGTFTFTVQVADSSASDVTTLLHERDGTVTVPNFSASQVTLVHPPLGTLTDGVLTHVQLKAWYNLAYNCPSCTCPNAPTASTVLGIQLWDGYGHAYPTDVGILDCQTEDKTLAEWGIPGATFPPGGWITLGPFTGTQCVLSNTGASNGHYETRMTFSSRGLACANGVAGVSAAGDSTNDQHIRVYGRDLDASTHFASVECSITIFLDNDGCPCPQ